MKLIEKLSEMIDEEIEDAGKYAKCALKYKEENPALSKTFYDLSTDEMRHMTLRMMRSRASSPSTARKTASHLPRCWPYMTTCTRSRSKEQKRSKTIRRCIAGDAHDRL